MNPDLKKLAAALEDATTSDDCLQAKDEDTIRNAHRMLAALGDAYSARAQDAHCWADLEDADWLADFDGVLSAFEAGRAKGTAAA